MICWLITNKYFISNNFIILKNLILESAKRHNIEIYEYNNIDVIKVLSKKNVVKPDFVLFWDKDVKLAYYLESEGIKLFNSAESIRLCDDKSLTFLKLRNKGIAQPKTIFSPLIYYHDLSEDDEFIDFAIDHIKFPLVYKECFGSFGQQVFLVSDRLTLKKRIKDTNVWPFIIQEFIKSSFGRDIRIYVVGDKVVGTMKRENKNGDFRANIEIGGVGSKYEANDKQIEMAIKVTKELKLDFAGVDILFGENDDPILCEVNSNAYFTGLNQVLNVHVEDYIFKYILDKLD